MNLRVHNAAYRSSMHPVRVGVRAWLAIVGFSFASASLAVSDPVAVEVTFVKPIAIFEQNALQYGLIDHNFADSETVIIAPDGLVTDTRLNVLGGAQSAAYLTVQATVGQSATVLINNIANGPGYTLSEFMCKYNGGAEALCSGGSGMNITTVESADLLVGVTITGGTGPAAPGPANGSFLVNINYE